MSVHGHPLKTMLSPCVGADHHGDSTCPAGGLEEKPDEEMPAKEADGAEAEEGDKSGEATAGNDEKEENIMLHANACHACHWLGSRGPNFIAINTLEWLLVNTCTPKKW
eukprot:2259123-Amphidinium_carterae.1